MELNEVVRRIFGAHGILILAFVTLGVAAAGVMDHALPTTYTATTRVILSVGDVRLGVVDSQSLADTGRGIVTSRSHVQAALNSIGASRDAAEIAANDITLKTAGSSGIVLLSVKDRNPTVAANLANALAQDLVNTFTTTAGGNVTQTLSALDAQIAQIDAKNADVDKQLAAANQSIAAGQAQETLWASGVVYTTPDMHRANLDQIQQAMVTRDALTRRGDELMSQRASLVSQRGSLQAAQATAPKPATIDPAVAPAQPDPSRTLVDLTLGLIAGLVLGIAIAAVRESFSPTLAGHYAVARASDAPHLGSLSKLPDEPSMKDLEVIAKGVRMAATAAGVQDVELVSAGAPVNLQRLAKQLSGQKAGATVHQFGTNGVAARKRPAGIVVVAPAVVGKSDLVPVANLQTITEWPVLGVVTYPPPTMWQRFARWRGVQRLGSRSRSK